MGRQRARVLRLRVHVHLDGRFLIRFLRGKPGVARALNRRIGAIVNVVETLYLFQQSLLHEGARELLAPPQIPLLPLVGLLHRFQRFLFLPGLLQLHLDLRLRLVLDSLLDIAVSMLLDLPFPLDGEVDPLVEPHSAFILLNILQLLQDLHLLLELALELLLLLQDLEPGEAADAHG